MRELSWLDTGYLAGGLLLCLALPSLLSLRGPLEAVTRGSCIWDLKMAEQLISLETALPGAEFVQDGTGLVCYMWPNGGPAVSFRAPPLAEIDARLKSQEPR